MQKSSGKLLPACSKEKVIGQQSSVNDDALSIGNKDLEAQDEYHQSLLIDLYIEVKGSLVMSR